VTPDDKKLLTTIVERHALVCALCMYAEPGGKAKTALTVIEGYAVCEDHMGYVAQGEGFASIVRAVRREA
jgi:hypothetical protein